METAGRMGRFGTLVLLLLVARVEGESLPLPSFMKACSRNDPKLNECAAASATPAIPKLKDGIPEYGVPPLDPLFVKRISIDKNLLGLGLDMTDVQLHGLSQSEVKSIRMDPNPPIFTWTLFAPRLTFLGKYEASGRVLLLPITGKGNINITLVDVEYTYQVDFDLTEREDGEGYLVPKTNSIQYKLQRIFFNLENLFNGNKALGDTMNAFLNENWREIERSFGKSFSAEIAVAAKSIIDGLTSKVAYNRFFPDEA